MSNPTEEDGTPPDWSPAFGHRTVTHAAITRFGELTGDYAQMHFDRDFGPAQGMGGTIAHGLLSAAWSIGALALHAPERLALGEPDAALVGYRVRFARMVFIDDLFSLRWRAANDAAMDGLPGSGLLNTVFEVVNQRGKVVTAGAVSVCRGRAGEDRALASADAPLDTRLAPSRPAPQPLHADEMVEFGPRGEGFGRTVTEADLVAWSDFTGALDPATLDAEFARTGLFTRPIAPPLWVFCRAFGDYLRDLLRVEMPSSGFAGHLGDAFRVVAPVHPGDTLTTRHRPVSYVPSRSRPGMGIVEFALQVVNQHDAIVQEGRVQMMMTARPQPPAR